MRYGRDALFRLPHGAGLAVTTSSLALKRYCFTSTLYCGSPSSFYSPPPHLQSLPYCNTIARPLRSIRPPHRPPFCMPYTIQYWWWRYHVKANFEPAALQRPLGTVESTEGISEIWFCELFPQWGFLWFRVGLGLLMVKSSPGVSPKPRFGPNLDSTGASNTPPHQPQRQHRCWLQLAVKKKTRGFRPLSFFFFSACFLPFGLTRLLVFINPWRFCYQDGLFWSIVGLTSGSPEKKRRSARG